MRAPPVSRLKRSCRRARNPSTPSSGSRAAASSIASGMPSRRRQISITAGRLAAVSANRGSAACARAWNSSTAPDCRAVSAFAPAGNRERAQPIHVLVGGPERFLARDEDAHPRRAGRDGVDQRRHRVRQMLAIVEHQQRTLRGELGSQDRGGGTVAGDPHPHRLRHRRRHECTIGEGAELHPPDAIRIVGGALRRDAPRHRLRDPGLPDAAGTRDRDHRMFLQQGRDCREIVGAAIEPRNPRRKVSPSLDRPCLVRTHRPKPDHVSTAGT